MKQLIFKYKNYILITLGVLTLIFFLIGKKSPPIPQIISFSPPSNSQGVDLRVVPIYLIDAPLTHSDLTLTSTPAFNFQLSQKDPGTILAEHSLAFQPATTYTLTLFWQGHVIQTHSFTTIKSQEDPLLIQNMKDELARDYPLAQKLPLSRPGFRVVYSAPMTLEITLKNEVVPPSEVIAEVKSWVAQSGGDASAHKYIVAP